MGGGGRGTGEDEVGRGGKVSGALSFCSYCG